MQGGRGRSHPFFAFGDPFAGFGGMPNLFGGRDPFDDPFFTNPMNGMLPPSAFGQAFMGANPFGSTLFGPTGSQFVNTHEPRMFDHMHSLPNASRAPVIEELDSDDEAEPGYRNQKHPHEYGTSSSQSYVEHPYEGRELQQTPCGNQLRVMHDTRSVPQGHSFTFQSSTVTYGGSNGAYYTSSTTRRDGSDGVRFEEHKEADSVTGQAAHRISRGIHDKGHTLSRHLKSDGHVDTKQTLHNINEDELTHFEEAWKGKARKHLPGWMGSTNAHNVGIEGSGEPSSRGGGWALPSTDNMHAGERRKPSAAKHAHSSKVRKC